MSNNLSCGRYVRHLAVMSALLLGSMGAALAENYIPATTNLTNLNGGMVCAIGSSKANSSATPPVAPYYLAKNSQKQGVWLPVTGSTPSVSGLEVGSDVTSIVTSPSDQPYINSALIRFFIIDNPKNVKCADIVFTFSNTSTGDINVTHYPYPNALFEMTAWPSGGDSLLTIDTSNVDSFQTPIAMTVTKGTTTLAELGNPVATPNAARTTMITGPHDTGGADSPFVTWLKAQPNSPMAFENLALSSAPASQERYPYAMLVSPKDYLNAKCTLNGSIYIPPTCSLNNAMLHWLSPLNSYFDAALTTFFKNATANPAQPLVVMSDASGSIPQGTWTATSSTTDCPVYMTKDGQSLTLTMAGNTTVICNPVGQVVPMSGPSPTVYDEKLARVQITVQQYETYSPKYTGWNFGQPETGFIGTVTGFGTDGGKYYVALKVLIKDGLPNLSFPAWAFTNIQFGLGLNVFETAGEMVFANDGAFAAWAPAYIKDNAALQTVTLSIQRNIVAAFSRGVANCNNVTMAGTVPDVCKTMKPGAMTSSAAAGAADAYWSNEVNWFPANGVQDYYAQYLHTAQLDAQGKIKTGATCPAAPCTNISSTPNNSIANGTVNSNQGVAMGMAYGFGYDENPVYVGNPPLVPSKLDPIPTSWGTGLSVTVTIGRTKPAN